MNKKLIENWNNVVSDKDKVYYLGDFALGSRNWNKRIFNQLNGQKYLVLGNHDGSKKKNLEMGFIDVYKQLELPDGVLLIHDPKKAEHKYKRVISGHVHQYWKNKKIGDRQFVNVGVDVRNFKPVLLEDVLEEFE